LITVVDWACRVIRPQLADGTEKACHLQPAVGARLGCFLHCSAKHAKHRARLKAVNAVLLLLLIMADATWIELVTASSLKEVAPLVMLAASDVLLPVRIMR